MPKRTVVGNDILHGGQQGRSPLGHPFVAVVLRAIGPHPKQKRPVYRIKLAQTRQKRIDMVVQRFGPGFQKLIDQVQDQKVDPRGLSAGLVDLAAASHLACAFPEAVEV